MDVIDFLVFFVWVFIFFIFFSFKSRKIENATLKKYHRWAFWLRVFSTLVYSMVVLYISPGDSTTLYYPEGINIQNLILKDFSNIKILIFPSSYFDQSLLAQVSNLNYFNKEGNFMVTRLVTLFSFFTFGKFMAISLFFSMFAFSGLWKLYLFFYKQNPALHKQFAIAILFLPSVIYWSSGILKDPLCIGALGWITYSLSRMLIEKKRILINLFFFLIFSGLLYIVKSYILLSYLPFFLLFFLLERLGKLKTPIFKFATIFILLATLILLFTNLYYSLETLAGDFVEQGVTETIESYQTSYENQARTSESNFSLGVEFDGTITGLVKIAPAAVVASLFRPFIWESKKVTTIFSSLESLGLMLFTLFILFKIGIIRTLKIIFSNPLIFYSLSFSLIFSIFVGATTLNFGSLVRYKIPALPFYLSSLFLIYHVGKLKIETKRNSKKEISKLKDLKYINENPAG